MTNHGTLLKSAPGNTRIGTTLYNRGIFGVTDGALHFFGGALVQTAGLTSFSSTNVQFTLSSGRGGFIDLQGGRLEAAALIQCRAFTNSALLAPGLPIGTLEIDFGFSPTAPGYWQTETGTLEIGLAGPTAGADHDELRLSSRGSLDGVLDLLVAEGYDPPLGQEFTIITGTALTGQFASVTGTALPGGKRFDVLYSNIAVQLRVVSNPQLRVRPVPTWEIHLQ